VITKSTLISSFLRGSPRGFPLSCLEERSKSTYEELEKIERGQEENFVYLDQEVDTQIGQPRHEIAGINSRIDTLIQIMLERR